MPTRLRIPLQKQKLDLSCFSAQKVGTVLRLVAEKLERNWPLSATVMLVAIVAAAYV